MFYGNSPYTAFGPGFSANNGVGPQYFGTGYGLAGWGLNPWQSQIAPTGLGSVELTQLTQRMDALCQQVAYLTDLVRSLAMPLASSQFRGLGPIGVVPSGPASFGGAAPITGTPGFMTGMGGAPVTGSSPVGVGYEHHSALQIRETENFICWQIPFQNLNLGDVEVEVLGNHVICRTKTVLHPSQRFWHWTGVPQGVQFFDLPDGRVECSCVIPVAFDPKEVEAVFKDGAISIYIPKAESSERHGVRIGKEAPQYAAGGSSGRKVSDLRT